MESDLQRVAKLPGGVKVSGATGSPNDVQAYLASDFEVFKLEAQDGSAVLQFPPLQIPFGEHQTKPAFVNLLNQRVGPVNTNDPLLSLGEENGVRYATLHGEGIWRWRIADRVQNGNQEVTNRVISKVVQYLTVAADKRKFRVSTRKQFDENERVIFSAELYNDNNEAVNDPEVTLEVTDESGNKTPYTFTRSGTGYRLDVGTLPAGSHRYEAFVELNGTRSTDRGELVVRTLLAEKVRTVADHNLLRAMSTRTGGLILPVSESERILEGIAAQKTVVPRSTSRAVLNDLIDLRWIFFLLLALLTLEWAVRRRNGAY